MVQVVIIEPQPLVRMGLAAILASITTNDQIKCHGYDDLHRNAPPAAPCDLVLLGARPEERINPLIQAVRQAHAPKRIVLMSETLSQPSAWVNLPSLVVNYVSFAWSPDAILEALHPLVQPEHYSKSTFGPQQQTQSNPYEPIGLSQPQPHPVPSAQNRRSGDPGETDEARMLGLTPRQYEVLVLLAQGHPIKLICRQLNISIATTKGHLESLYQRLGVHNRNEAVFVAIARGATLKMATSQSPTQPLLKRT